MEEVQSKTGILNFKTRPDSALIGAPRALFVVQLIVVMVDFHKLLTRIAAKSLKT